jgi:hypothetical protein
LNNTWHCELCNHQRKNLKEGSICNLTKQKPAFNPTCSKKLFSTKFKNQLREVNVVYEHAVKKKSSSYASVFVFGSLALGLLGIGVYFLIYMKSIIDFMKSPSAYMIFKLYSTPFFFFLLSYQFFSHCFKIYNMYILKSREAKRKKNRVDAVLALYGITYDIDVQLHPNYRFPQDAQVDLQINILR